MPTAAPLLIEIGCEEIPARMIKAASADLGRRVAGVLEKAVLEHGPIRTWGGSRRLAVRVEAVQARQPDREELVLGPPAKVALTAEGQPTPAAVGFARKQGIDPELLTLQETDRGEYVGFRREVAGKSLSQVLADGLPASVESMSFPKTMRWGDGRYRWVRPVHWLLALHGPEVLSVELFGVRAAAQTHGHRFLAREPIEVADPDGYVEALLAAGVVVDPEARRKRLSEALEQGAATLGGRLVDDPQLLDEVVDLVELPGVTAGRFDPSFLELPRELLVTTLRHHQKCFSVQDGSGRLIAGFLAVTNTAGDPAGHIRRGNEWVVGGRLDDARFFWLEDLKQPLAARSERLAGVTFHAKTGSYRDKAARMEALAVEIARRLDCSETTREHCRLAARLAKNDLLTGSVGEFPELQGKIGGLLLATEGAAEPVASGVYSHYQPMGPEDSIPPSDEGCVVALADKLDSTFQMIRIGQRPTGSRDPFGLRRATAGIFRILIEREWPLSMRDLLDLAERSSDVFDFLSERLRNFLRDSGATRNEVSAVLSIERSREWSLHDVMTRVRAIGAVREREDFERLVDLTKRIYNIIPKAKADVLDKQDSKWSPGPENYEKYDDPEAAGRELRSLIETLAPSIDENAKSQAYDQVIDSLARFVEPVDRFFNDVLVIDPERPDDTYHRREMLVRLGGVLTRFFDIRELAGQADRRAQ